MSIKINNSGISNISSDTDRIYTIYKGDKLIKFNYTPVVNYIFRDIDENGNLTLATGNLEDGSEITKISDYEMYYAFYLNNGLTGSVNLSKVKQIGRGGLSQAFSYCTGITSVNLSSLITVDAYGLSGAFYSCTNLSSVNLSNLKEIKGELGLQTAFYNCTSLTSITFNNLESIYGNSLEKCFSYCSNLADIYFPALKSTSNVRSNSFNSMLTYNRNVCRIHFPSNMESIMSSWASVTNKFGHYSQSDVSVLFDLPATE